MKTAVIIPNFNGNDYIDEAILSILTQSQPNTLIVVDNGSTDDSLSTIERCGGKIVIIKNDINKGYTGGINPGITFAIKNSYDAVAFFNNDAVADKNWLKELVKAMQFSKAGIVTGRLQTRDGSYTDTTGEQFTIWGLPFPRGRGVKSSEALIYKSGYVFGATGGATLYSLPMLQDIGMLDQDFFAYYEDADLSFRAQLFGYRVFYCSTAVAYHRISETSNKMGRGFKIYQAFKNMPILIIKNVPAKLLIHVMPRFCFAYALFFLKAIIKGNGWAAVKGVSSFIYLLPKKIKERKFIQKSIRVDVGYIKSMIVYDLPPEQTGLRKLRDFFIH